MLGLLLHVFYIVICDTTDTQSFLHGAVPRNHRQPCFAVLPFVSTRLTSRAHVTDSHEDTDLLSHPTHVRALPLAAVLIKNYSTPADYHAGALTCLLQQRHSHCAGESDDSLVQRVRRGGVMAGITLRYRTVFVLLWLLLARCG